MAAGFAEDELSRYGERYGILCFAPTRCPPQRLDTLIQLFNCNRLSDLLEQEHSSGGPFVRADFFAP